MEKFTDYARINIRLAGSFKERTLETQTPLTFLHGGTNCKANPTLHTGLSDCSLHCATFVDQTTLPTPILSGPIKILATPPPPSKGKGR